MEALMRDRTAVAESTGYEVTLGNGQLSVVPMREGRPELDRDPACPRCGGSCGQDGEIHGGYVPVRVEKNGMDYPAVAACPECVYGAIRAKTLRLRFAASAGYVPPIGLPCHATDPVRLNALAAMRKLVSTPHPPRVGEYVYQAERQIAEGADPQSIAKRWWWLPDGARQRIRSMAYAAPETPAAVEPEDSLPF